MQRQPEYITRAEATPREQLADQLWNTGQRILMLETAVKNSERRFGKTRQITKRYRAQLKEAQAEQARLRKELNLAR